MPDGILELWMYPRDNGTCKGPNCRASIVWRKSVEGKVIPFNVNPDPIERRTHVSGRLVEYVPMDDMHHRTCPDVASFSRGAKPAKKESALCLPLE